MQLVYETFADEPDNVLANGIIEAADAYVEHEKAQLSQQGTTKDTISRQAAIDIFDDYNVSVENGELEAYRRDRKRLCELPAIQPEDYTELKQEFLRMAGYIDVLLECSDTQKETLIGFISRLAEFMPWTERD